MIIVLYSIKKNPFTIVLSLFILLGILRVIYHPVQVEQSKLEGSITVSGTVISKALGEFGESFILEDVSLYEKDERLALKSKVKVVSSKPTTLIEGYTVQITGKVKPEVKVYNPSDLDYEAYLKSQGIVCEIQLTSIKEVEQTIHGIHVLRNLLKAQIDQVFLKQDQGLVRAFILGDTKEIDEQTKEMYRHLGMSHILALSGLHLSLVSGMLWYLLGKLDLKYGMRQVLSLVVIWFYASLTSMSVSIVRACIMLSVTCILRSLWEEEDFFTNCALAALIILWINPFCLNQVGFQLSFVSIIGIGVVRQLERFIKYILRPCKKVFKCLKVVMPSFVLTLFLSPIIAYYFYEIPVLGIVFNLLLIPVFSLLIPVMFLLLGMSFILSGASVFLAQGLIGVLNGIAYIGHKVELLPFLTCITGRPSPIQLVSYYISLLSGVAILSACTRQGQIRMMKEQLIPFKAQQRSLLKQVDPLKLIALCLGLICFIFTLLYKDNRLEITQLYIGQGDCSVITTPNQETILIDSGPELSSRTLLNYLKYKGIKKIDLAILSHPHEDHIGGLIGLLEEGFKVEGVVWADSLQEDPYRSKLINLCQAEAIPLYNVYKGDCIEIGDVKLEVLWPQRGGNKGLDMNENSLVCLLTYHEVTQLFTGDIGFKAENQLIHTLKPVNLLKVAHHGSKNSTSSKFIEKVRPEYGMISAGISNRYGHPHDLTLERLEAYQVPVYTTSKQGALSIRTDGRTYTVQTYLQEEKRRGKTGDYTYLWAR